MISFVGKRPRIPAGFGASVKSARAKVARWVKKGKRLDGEAFTPKLWNAHKHVLAKAQHYKCAYCECPVAAKSNAVVDHYRPKAAVQALEGGDRDDLQGKPPARKEKGPVEPGYHWLAYTWKNYLIACHDCNEVWKQSQFPIAGKRATKRGEENVEGALLLNPLDIDPVPHLQYDDLAGIVQGCTDEGKSTIDVCGLDRMSLAKGRAAKAAKIQKLLDEVADAVADNSPKWKNCTLKRLLGECADPECFAGMARYLLNAGLGMTYDDLRLVERKGLLD
jgi:hypothetical protein